MTSRPRTLSLALVALLLASPLAPAQEDSKLRFAVSFTSGYSREAKTGTLYLLLTEDLVGEPRNQLFDWPVRGYVFRQRVLHLEMGEPVVFDERTAGFPASLADIRAQRYNIQAVLDVHPNEHEFTIAPGNGRSRSRRLDLDPATSGTIQLKIDTEIQQNPLRDVSRVRYRTIESRMAGRHIGHRFFVTVAVVLPPSYGKDPSRRHPVQYWIPALGRSPRGAVQYFQGRGVFNLSAAMDDKIGDFIYVLLGSHGKRGHHLWVDSDNNGPMRTALFEEIIPAIEEEFAILPAPAGRFLVGHGAGGWAALNLMIHRPDAFAGVWALAPDPVDFRDLFGIDIYASPPPNAFVDEHGATRAFVQEDGRMVVSIRTQSDYEAVVGTGNQFQSMAAAFGPRRGDGTPAPLFDAMTGALDPDVVRSWRRHDLRALIAEHGARLAPSLHRKINIYVGRRDNYGLVRPILGLADAMAEQGIDARVEVIPGLDHAGMASEAIHERVQLETTEAWRRTKPK